MSRRIFLAAPSLRSALISRQPAPSAALSYSSSAPNITSASFWKSLVPKPLRRGDTSTSAKKGKKKSKEWNPATFFINIFLLIGSMSIQMIALRNDFAAFNRRADAKIGLLKEIIERVQKGEDVDVEGLLGAGDKEKEKEWEEVLLEIEREDEAWERSRRQKPKHGRNLDDNATERPPAEAQKPSADIAKPKTNAPPGFY
ncbi:hypothetical protein BP6252_07932 [Coleophoma cylindrospora]|uniref:Uncharacterized protein n=1 Tax=Coleophoma cylindrospora TaxID=1849047 RepID=A0A3D8RBD6_9HELO|nr:hypothetical protein BP6252_07932 [Coleophoma cylindrospora]